MFCKYKIFKKLLYSKGLFKKYKSFLIFIFSLFCFELEKTFLVSISLILFAEQNAFPIFIIINKKKNLKKKNIFNNKNNKYKIL